MHLTSCCDSGHTATRIVVYGSLLGDTDGASCRLFDKTHALQLATGDMYVRELWKVDTPRELALLMCGCGRECFRHSWLLPEHTAWRTLIMWELLCFSPDWPVFRIGSIIRCHCCGCGTWTGGVCAFAVGDLERGCCRCQGWEDWLHHDKASSVMQRCLWCVGEWSGNFVMIAFDLWLNFFKQLASLDLETNDTDKFLYVYIELVIHHWVFTYNCDQGGT